MHCKVCGIFVLFDLERFPITMVLLIMFLQIYIVWVIAEKYIEYLFVTHNAFHLPDTYII